MTGLDCAAGSAFAAPLMLLAWAGLRAKRKRAPRSPLPSVADRVTAANLEQDERARALQAERAAGLAQLAAREAEVEARHDAAQEALRKDPRAFIRDRLKGRE